VKYLLDTHAWIWWNSHPESLSQEVRKLISDPKMYDVLLLSAISPWEFCKLLENGRIGITCDPEEWLNTALDMPRLQLVPLTHKIAYRSTVLPGPFHNDPADQIIVATAQENNATIITKDRKIIEYRHVRTFW